MVKAVIFDRDGVIFDSEPVATEAAFRALKKLGINITNEEKKFIAGKHSDDFKDLLLNKYDFSWEEFGKLAKETYYEMLKDAPFFEHTIKLIKKLHARRIPLAITTSAGREGTLQVIEKAGLNGFFNVIVTREDYTNRKPDPEPYIITAKKLNAKPNECLVFEDTSQGVESAKKAGMKCIAIPNEHTKNQDFSKADKIIISPEDISRYEIII